MPTLSATDRAAVIKSLELLDRCAGQDRRLSDDDIRTAARTDPAAAPLVNAVATFLRESTKANGHSIVSMNAPLGTRETSKAKICDEFLAHHTVPAPATVSPPAPPPLLPMPSPAEVSSLLGVLTKCAGKDGTLASSDFARAYEENPEDVALLAQLGTFLRAAAQMRGEKLSMEKPGGEGLSRADVCDAFLAHLQTLKQPLDPARPPKMGDRRPIPGTRGVNAPEQVYQYGQWLDFKYDPMLMASGSTAARRYYPASDEWSPTRPSTGDERAQLAWERKNPLLAQKIRSRSAPLRFTRHWQAVEANDRAERDRLEAQAQAALVAANPWALGTDNFSVRMRMNQRRVYAIITGNGGGGYASGRGGSGWSAVDVPGMRVVDRSGHSVVGVDLPAMDVVDSNSNLVSGWISSVDARWNAATGNNFNGGTFVYGAPGR